VSGASERANGRASGSVLQSVFLAVFDHSVSPTLSLSPPLFFGIVVLFFRRDDGRIEGADPVPS